ERDLGAVPKTLFYEHDTVRDAAKFLVSHSLEALCALFGRTAVEEQPLAAIKEIKVTAPIIERTMPQLDDIAIIGIHGAYPHSTNLEEYWDNLKNGRDLIDVIPRDRWNAEEFYDSDPKAAENGKIYCKWGGFLESYDKFDPEFFSISPSEARVMDPQERLFLQSVWAAIEDAGYTRDSMRQHFLKERSLDVGVFVGVTTNSYHLWATEESNRGNHTCPSAMPWSIANRVSYFFDFNGPSMPVDTACSSSLAAIHLACESLKKGECQLAVAGGVNLYLHPSKYLSLCQRRMLSLDGKCRSYGAGGDGFVPGEGVGTVLLKPLSRAVAERDHIYAVIRASAFEHAGRSNGYSAPNPKAQANLIGQIFKKAGLAPETIGYVEGHGTGTQLGDSIEIAALTQAFDMPRKHFCPVGCVKANIGHSESASGIAGLTKIILQMKHRQLAPSISSDEPNPNIEFADSPLYLQHGLSEWPSPPANPRRALINSFGAGGVNACAIVEEYNPPALRDTRPTNGPWVFTLSARNQERLRQYAESFLVWLRSPECFSIESFCYTLQTGREMMNDRLAIVFSETNELTERLTAWVSGDLHDGVFHGSPNLKRPKSSSALSASEAAAAWVEGVLVDWDSLYSTPKPPRMSLPTYPFAPERHWIADSAPLHRQAGASMRMHPLLSFNCSTLSEIAFSSWLPDDAFYATAHKVDGQRILPGAAFLEIACTAGTLAGEQRVRKIKDVVWMHPVNFAGGPQILRTSLKRASGSIEFAISSLNDSNETMVHAEGRLEFAPLRTHSNDDTSHAVIEALKAQCEDTVDGSIYYRELREHGFDYGPAFQTIREIHACDVFALSRLVLADHLKADFDQYILHPGLVDAAFQTAACLLRTTEFTTPHVPFALDEIEILRPLPRTCYARAEFADSTGHNHGDILRFNIQLLNDRGEMLVNFRNLYVRKLAVETESAAMIKVRN
ncbi:MAG: type I polyketide synthase, partial [Terracidiphilus sp.]